jgi:DNA (cytosine-5)-methyltransferase 1
VARGVRADSDRQPDLFGEILPDEAAVRSRATMWDVPRYLEAMIIRGRPVLGAVIENVVDVERWVMRPAWKQAIRALGYDIYTVYLNSMHARPKYGSPIAPQSRDRGYDLLVHKSVGRTPNLAKWLHPIAECPEHGLGEARQAFKNGVVWGRYRAQYVYVCAKPGCAKVVEPQVLPAAAAIDWSKPGIRIGDRPRPLANKTIARIRAGLERYARPVAVPMEGREGKQPWPLDDQPMRTVTTRAETGIAHLPGQFMPFIAEMRGGGSEKKARGVNEPLATVCASGNHHGLVTGPQVPPFLLPLRSGRNRSLLADRDPLATIVADGANHALVTSPEPLLVPVGGTWNDGAQPISEPMRTRTTRETDALLVPYYGNGTASPTSRPMPALTTVDRHALVSGEDGDGLIHGIAIEDCLLRMLDVPEIGKAMAFHAAYRLLGTRRERVRQYGNGVTPPAAEVLTCALVETVTGEEL